MKHENDIFQLARQIVKSVKGVLDKQEEDEMNEWIRASSRHADLYERVRQVKNLERRIAAKGKIDVQAECKFFLARLNRIKRRRMIRRSLYYAAMLALPVIMITWFMKEEHDFAPKDLAKVQSIDRKLPKAILTLARGEEIELSEEKINIDEINGRRIKAKENTLAYEQEPDTLARMIEEMIYNKLTVPRGGEYLLALSDGTEIWLNAESEIRYPVHFTGKTREVYLKGEAFFSVAKNEHQPFIVISGETRVEVLGTSFNLRCYPEEGEISTTLVSGVVAMSRDKQMSLKLFPGEQGVFNKEEVSLHKHKVETRFYTAWKDGRLVFRETRLEDLLNTLARWYDLNIIYTNVQAKEIRFTGDLDKTDDFRTLLEMLERGKRISCSVQDRNVFVSLR